MKIYGAGMSGLLAAHMLRRFNPVVYEAATSLPNNHAALLRFRSDAVSRETGIKFKKVWVQKAVLGLDNNLTTDPTIKEQNLYSLKVSNSIIPRSIGNMVAGERFIAPEDFIAQLAKNIPVKYNNPLSELPNASEEPIISTIPMNVLMNIAQWSELPEFHYSEITTITADILTRCDIYQTIYIPHQDKEAYRVSITGNKLIIECIDNGESIEQNNLLDMATHYASLFFGQRIPLDNIQVKKQKYGKLINSPGRTGRDFILAMTDLYNLYSLGRFATWRQILLDDVVNDVKVIETIISDKDSYSHKIKKVK